MGPVEMRFHGQDTIEAPTKTSGENTLRGRFAWMKHLILAHISQIRRDQRYS